MIKLRRNTVLVHRIAQANMVRVGSNGADALPPTQSGKHSLPFDLFLAVLFGGAFALGATLVGKVIS